MKRERILNSREFQHKFSQLSQSLKPGQKITVTRHGNAIGYFTSASKSQPPDFLANLEKLGGSKKVGQKLIDQICGLS